MFLRIARNMALQYQMKSQENPSVTNGSVAVRDGALCIGACGDALCFMLS